MPESLQNRPYFGVGPAIEKVKWDIIAAASANCAVLIRGETGSGKGMTARRIHDLSPRKNHPFVDINCSGLGGDLLKSELFGHAKGAFTGSVGDRPGLIEEANRGTLFLDEIGDMDPGVQCLLLKAIEEKAYRRVGENGKRSSDFRLICATNRDLPEAMKYGSFRSDLFYRINTLFISIPPLRRRKEDIAGLMTHILRDMNYNLFPLGGDVINTLTRYPWPGNIRELRNAAERALIFAKGKPLAPQHFANLGDDGIAAATFQETTTADNAAKTAGTEPIKPNDSIGWALQELETRQIIRALKAFDGDRIKACNALGISISSLYRKLEKTLNGVPLEEWLKGGGLEIIK